jgi:hypothetical protein
MNLDVLDPFQGRGEHRRPGQAKGGLSDTHSKTADVAWIGTVASISPISPVAAAS